MDGHSLMLPNFSFLAAKMWNSLPPYIREAKDFLTFKRILNKHTF